MSDVRLSTGSPSLERMDVRHAEQPKPSACRNLFGPLDHEELKRDLKGRLREMEEAASAKWSFDFVNHKPIPNGSFEWQAVDGDLLPDFYRLQRAPGNKRVDLNGNHEREQQQQRERSAADCNERSPGSVSAGQPVRAEVPAGPPQEDAGRQQQQEEEIPGNHAERRKRAADRAESLSRRKRSRASCAELTRGVERTPPGKGSPAPRT